MTEQSASPATGPHELLSAVRDLTRQVRSALRGTRFPLLVFAAITLASIPVYRYAPHSNALGTCRSGSHGTSVCSGVNSAAFGYWLVALILAHVAIEGFYVRRSRRRGVGTPIRGYVIVGIVLPVVTAGATAWLVFRPMATLSAGALHASTATRFVHGLVTPMAAIGLALLMLAWVERNRALLAYSIVYLVVVLAQAGQVTHGPSPWSFLPYVLIPAAVLLAGSAVFGLFRTSTERGPR
jgi:hypothetical protein